jgi:hypothetical protein
MRGRGQRRNAAKVDRAAALGSIAASTEAPPEDQIMAQPKFRSLLLASIGALTLAACQDAAPPAAAPEAETVVVAEEEPVTETVSLLPKMVCGPDGFIRQDATRESLAETFGAENLVEEELPWVDSVETALVLFPDEPATRTEMFWLDKTSGGPRYVSAGGAAS